MSVNCPITVQCEIRDPGRLAPVARTHLDRLTSLQEDPFEARDAKRFLKYVAEGHGVGHGPKGQMLTWGSVGNYSDIDAFVEDLCPFWFDLYAEAVMFTFDTIVVMMQVEQRVALEIYEISLKGGFQVTPDSSLVLRDMKTPFPLFGWLHEREKALLPSSVKTGSWSPK